ncbi:MAG: ABC transporter substrate-binding protein, partial [Planctomycetia bacterium]|nr:ABC transporter substrate-binding protein [Planctomycetia bacterium]
MSTHAPAAPAATDALLVRVGHSPDPDDAFMFYALAADKIATGRYRFVHELVDIETLNRRAFAGELELTALSIHAYAHLADRYVLCPCGASMGDGYGPIVVARRPLTKDETAAVTIAVPGTLTSAFLSLSLWLGRPFRHVVVPFDRILDVVEAGQWNGEPVDAGLVIHEGQLTYQEQNLRLIVDLGVWWKDRHGLPLPLGANGVRRDLGPAAIRDITRLLSESIDWGLDHRAESLDYAMRWGRNLDAARTDRFVGMYVNEWTRDFGEPGRRSVKLFLEEAFEAGLIPQRIDPEFVEP